MGPLKRLYKATYVPLKDYIWLMGENSLNIMFGETVKKLVFERAEKNTMTNNKMRVKI